MCSPDAINMKIEIEYSEEEEKAAREMTQPYRKYINENAPLLSLLYDIDLMPEQIVLHVNALRMIAVCELFKMTNNHGDNHVPLQPNDDVRRTSAE